MPIYLYKCPACTTRLEVWKKIAQLDEPTNCNKCTFVMERQLTAPAIAGDFQAYNCPITGDRIEGRRAHEKNLEKHGCRVLEPGESEQFKKRQERENAQLEDNMAETAASLVANMPTEKRERLCAEIENGLDIAVTRE